MHVRSGSKKKWQGISRGASMPSTPFRRNIVSDIELDFVKIPASEFTMGSSRAHDRQAHDDEMPAQVLAVTDYMIMRYPVTNSQYAKFVQATGHRSPLFWKDGSFPAGREDHPVVGVSYYDAIAFCAWAAEQTGLPVRLPTEPEWEKAARGPQARLYSWGQEWSKGLCFPAKKTERHFTVKYSPRATACMGLPIWAGMCRMVFPLFGAYPRSC
jgi:serine/threonine-protein kinase